MTTPERMWVPDDAVPERITIGQRWDWTVAELRELARQNDVPFLSRHTHEELVDLLWRWGVDVPAKPPQRMPMTPKKPWAPKPKNPNAYRR
jgi:hypothetical protein